MTASLALFTSWTFWIGAAWGFCGCATIVYHWLAKPMGLLLGFEPGPESLPCEQGERLPQEQP